MREQEAAVTKDGGAAAGVSGARTRPTAPRVRAHRTQLPGRATLASGGNQQGRLASRQERAVATETR